MATDAASTPITFVVPGRRLAAAATRSGGGASSPPLHSAAVPRGTVKERVQVAALRAGSDAVRVVAVPGDDVVVLHVAGGPPLVLHPANARDLMLAQAGAKRDATPAGGDVDVPVQLRWRGLEAAAPTRTRGFLGDVLLAAFEVVTGLGREPLAKLTAAALLAHVDGQVDAGVYALSEAPRWPLKGQVAKLDAVPPSTEPLLVLIHGTFVDTASTFGKLWTAHPQRVRQLFAHYARRVYALDHPTLGASPIANALTLVQALPAGARLHLVTHSRGGLVAEVLARVAAQPTLTADDLAAFAGDVHAPQRAELQALAEAVAAKAIRVERVVRVACPARGTLLASKRLDAYLSVLKWALELSGVPALPTLVDFVAEVARRRADPLQIPGLAAMIPETPLVDWLTAAPAPIPGALRVVAGDLEGDSVASWLKTLLADAYYWTDNDVVVQTRSMYGGAPRAGGASFLLDQGGRANHFNYFVNQRSAAAVVDALTLDQPPGYAPIGPLSWAGLDAGGTRAAAPPRDAGKPAVFVLPGILGSHLAVGGKRVWLGVRLLFGLEKLRYTPGRDDDVEPDGAIGLVYDALIDHLRASHDVVEFAYDWRRPLEHEAQRLADAIDAALDLRAASGQPVRLLAHSMGGLLARTVQLERPATWQRMLTHAGGRLVMLGTPNGGSWSPMQVLSGDDTMGNTLAAVGSPLRDRAARQLMAELPGFLQLQAALTDPETKLADAKTWRDMARRDLAAVQQANWWHRSAGEAMVAAYEWGEPTQAVLDDAVALRRRLDEQVRTDLPGFADRLLLVVGRAKFTPDGTAWADGGLVYRDAVDGGDGRVTRASALLPGVRTWSLDVGHGGLPEAKAAFAAFTELLVDGTTARLPPLAAEAPGAVRGGAAAAAAVAAVAAAAIEHVASRPSRGRASSRPPTDARAVFDVSRRDASTAADAGRAAPLAIGVMNGNVSFTGQPLLVGHYRSSLLTGAERVVDGLVGGAMRAALDAGLYPDACGTQQIFVNTWRLPDNPWRLPRPTAVVVVGLGEEGALTEKALRTSVRQATIAWAQRVFEDTAREPGGVELAATLMGSGGLGISPAGSARAIVQGVHEANERLADSGWPRVARITLIELYLDRASDAWRGLQVLATASPDRFELAPTIASGTGPLRRQVTSGYRGTDYDFITATAGALPDSIAFTLDTRRAATEMRSQTTQRKLLRDLVARASTDAVDDPGIGRTLFQLLVPLEVEPFLGGTERMLLELDETTAPIPWELLEAPADREVRGGRGDLRPWAVRCHLVRKLRTDRVRPTRRDATVDDAVLVVGEPLIDDPHYGPLPGALAEAKAVAAQLTGPDGLAPDRVRSLVDAPDAGTVIGALLSRPWRIVHVAGHGAYGPDGGVVLSGGTFLGPREIETMRNVPELVFVNCCHLAGVDAARTLAPPLDRSAFAAGVAEALIEIGVRCVVAAGWAVDDGPAETFAKAFYRELLNGQPFIDAVGAARYAAWADAPDGKTWAAYQCYGDPGWVFRAAGGDAQTVLRVRDADGSAVASAMALALLLEELVVQLRWGGADAAHQLERARELEARFGALWGDIGAIAEAFGLVYAEGGDFAAAIGWYERAVGAADGSATLAAVEQLENLRARHAWEAVAATDASSPQDAATARERLSKTLERLTTLAGERASVERWSLVGSGYKRLAMVERRAGRAAAARRALDAAIDAYAAAEALAGDAVRFYPALNRIALEIVVHGGDAKWPGLDAERLNATRSSLAARMASDPDFWASVGQTEVELYAALAERRLAQRAVEIGHGYADVWARVRTAKSWRSVADQARFVLDAVADDGAVRPSADAKAARALREQLDGYARGQATTG